MIALQDAEVEFIRNSLTPVVEVVQGDSGRELRCNITDMDIPDNSTARIYGVKPSKVEFLYDCTISDQYVSVELTNQMLAEIGDVKFQILITDLSGKEVTSQVGILKVGESLISTSAIESTNEFTALEIALQKIDNMVLKTDEITNTEIDTVLGG